MDTASTPSILLLNLPKDALAGIDLLSFTTTPRFQGIKNLPPGYHFVFIGSDTYLSLRHGAWFRIDEPKSDDRPDIVIKNWNEKTGDLQPTTQSAEALRLRANIGSLWKNNLTPYRQTSKNPTDAPGEVQEESNDWNSLTTHVHLVAPRITSGSENHYALSSASSASRDLDDIPGLPTTENPLNAEEKTLTFLPIDLKQTWAIGATGRERTEAAQDRSWALQSLLQTHAPATTAKTETAVLDEILGELQFTFLAVLTLNNWSCLEQWKRLLTLLLTCKNAVASNADFFVEILSSLKLQLSHCADAEAGLFDLTDENESLLKSLLVRFRKGLVDLEGEGVADVREELEALEKWLTGAHGWSFGGDYLRAGMVQLEDGEQVFMETTRFDEENETGDFAPQVVELSAEQKRELGLDGDEMEGVMGAGAEGGGVVLTEAKNGKGLKSLPQEYSLKVVDDESSSDEDSVASVYSDDLEDVDGSYGMKR
ncbi:hypothetical protein MBLNU230_g2052t1 [Neophaeotheca triangularis]